MKKCYNCRRKVDDDNDYFIFVKDGKTQHYVCRVCIKDLG